MITLNIHSIHCILQTKIEHEKDKIEVFQTADYTKTCIFVGCKLKVRGDLVATILDPHKT